MFFSLHWLANTRDKVWTYLCLFCLQNENWGTFSNLLSHVRDKHISKSSSSLPPLFYPDSVELKIGRPMRIITHGQFSEHQFCYLMHRISSSDFGIKEL